MEEFIARITERIAVFDWQGPGMFGIILLAVLGLIKQFKVVLITLFTVALAWGAGDLVILNLIIAGTNPLATDMVAAKVMGFEAEEISTFEWAWKAGMEPTSLDDIEVRGAELDSVTTQFKRARSLPYSHFRDQPWWCTNADLPKKE